MNERLYKKMIDYLILLTNWQIEGFTGVLFATKNVLKEVGWVEMFKCSSWGFVKYFNILILYQASNWVSRRFTGAELHLINLSYKGINSDTGHWGSGPGTGAGTFLNIGTTYKLQVLDNFIILTTKLPDTELMSGLTDTFRIYWRKIYSQVDQIK